MEVPLQLEWVSQVSLYVPVFVCVCACQVASTMHFVCNTADAPAKAFISSFDANDVRHKVGMQQTAN